MKIDKEILTYFVDESNQVLTELAQIVEQLEETADQFPAMLLSDFSQKIDRIMGASKTMSIDAPEHMGFQRISKIAELCKLMGRKATEKKSTKLLPLYAAFWSDTIEVTQSLIASIEDVKKTEEIAKSFPAVLQRRLEWLLARTDPATASKSSEDRFQEVQDLLKSLGLS